ncbi:hypothetical protein [Acidithrix sp. C25]|nr:hypothetical protein [Acidithrix sp. C25]
MQAEPRVISVPAQLDLTPELRVDILVGLGGSPNPHVGHQDPITDK